MRVLDLLLFCIVEDGDAIGMPELYCSAFDSNLRSDRRLTTLLQAATVGAIPCLCSNSVTTCLHVRCWLSSLPFYLTYSKPLAPQLHATWEEQNFKVLIVTFPHTTR